MHVESGLDTGLLFSFLLVLCRVGCVFVFVPFPGAKSMPDLPKIVFALFITMALFPFWPAVHAGDVDMARMLLWVVTEVGFGLFAGLVVAFLSEGFIIAAQVAGLQAGYSYASTIDPTTQADSGILATCVQLMAGMLFFGFRLDAWIIRILAHSLSTVPPGGWAGGEPPMAAIIRLGAAMFTTGLKLALPVVALLLLVDIALALLGRIASQLQLLTLAFPLKMLGALVALALLTSSFPAAYEKAAARAVETLGAAVR
jgi:flagellar biosynthetic protein FliR